VAGLNREQIVELATEDNVIVMKKQIDTWDLNYKDILTKLFDTQDPEPKKTTEELQELLSTAPNDEVRSQILEDIERLKESDLYKNDWIRYLVLITQVQCAVRR
jgi:hypothetical protein